ncbi:MAG TPA: phage tail sheath subtilisin-like domain-containing protein [Longimicrobium sp.]|nr:phage tail sheath subtilisin-like domain-containing protein [Longimicrobium sp.]
MPQYLSPGVYVEEVESSIQPIAGVGTSTAGFIGLVGPGVAMPPMPGRFLTDEKGNFVNAAGALLGPDEEPVPVSYPLSAAGEAQLVTSWESFKNQFGDFHADNHTLAHAVYGFFNNGGTRCWVTRVDELAAEAVLAALRGFETIDEIAIVAVPGATNAAIQEAMVSHCEGLGDRFAILDGQPLRNGEAWTAGNIRGGAPRSAYAALYFPWIAVYDPASGDVDFVPPSGHVAGIYARVDSERGVHKAPANERVRGALGLEWRLGRADQDGLNPEGINVIRDLNGAVTLWGARTLAPTEEAEWKYVNVRRLFLYLRESIDEGTQWVVFEPNTPALWSKITRNVTAFLTNVWRAGALFGNTPGEAFYVRCDAATNPPEVRNLGQVVTEVGVAVAHPAEFVVFRVSQWGGPGAA